MQDWVSRNEIFVHALFRAKAIIVLIIHKLIWTALRQDLALWRKKKFRGVEL